MFQPRWILADGDVAFYMLPLRYIKLEANGTIVAEATITTDMRTSKVCVETFNPLFGVKTVAYFETRADALLAMGIEDALAFAKCPDCGHMYHVAGHATAHAEWVIWCQAMAERVKRG